MMSCTINISVEDKRSRESQLSAFQSQHPLQRDIVSKLETTRETSLTEIQQEVVPHSAAGPLLSTEF